MRNKRQHTVPRAYLERFVDPDAPAGHEPSLWVLERSSNEPYRQAPQNAEVRSYYYSHTDADGNRSEAVDEILQRFESAGLPVLRRLEKDVDPPSLSDADKGAAAYFIGALAVRIPGFRDGVESFMAEIAEDILLLGAHRKEYFERTMRNAATAAGKEPPEDIEAVRQFALSKEYTISVNPTASLQHMMPLIPVGAGYAYNYNWRVLEAPSTASFVTSDRPLVLVSTLKQPAFYGLGAGWESPWMEATLPLSPRSLLLISRHHPPGREVVTERVVQEANMRTATFAERVLSSGNIDSSTLNRPNPWEGWVPLSEALVPELRDHAVHTGVRVGERK